MESLKLKDGLVFVNRRHAKKVEQYPFLNNP